MSCGGNRNLVIAVERDPIVARVRHDYVQCDTHPFAGSQIMT